MGIKVRILSKPDCHLCDIAKERIERVRSLIPFDLEEIDISVDSDLYDSYKERIPVVEIDGEEVFVYRVSEKILLKRLKERRK